MTISGTAAVRKDKYMNNDKEPFGKTCPVCRTEWSKVPRIVCNEYWWHCEKCEKKAKDIIEEENKNKKAGFADGGISDSHDPYRELWDDPWRL
jgi:ribosomal protein L37AE/L43A